LQLPDGDLFLLDRATSDPELREFLNLAAGVDQEVSVFFTLHSLAQRYADSRPDEGWEVTAMGCHDLLHWLVESYRLGMTQALIDLTPEGKGQLVPIFRILVESQ